MFLVVCYLIHHNSRFFGTMSLFESLLSTSSLSLLILSSAKHQYTLWSICEWTDIDINWVMLSYTTRRRQDRFESKKTPKTLITYQSLICCSVINSGVISTICASLFSNSKNENKKVSNWLVFHVAVRNFKSLQINLVILMKCTILKNLYHSVMWKMKSES